MKKAKHYLLTITLNSGIHLNSYLITTDDAHIKGITNRLLDKADELGGDYLPIVLVTNLGTGEKVVKDYLREYAPETRQWLDTVTNFHHTMWAMHESDPESAKLMALH